MKKDNKKDMKRLEVQAQKYLFPFIEVEGFVAMLSSVNMRLPR